MALLNIKLPFIAFARESFRTDEYSSSNEGTRAWESKAKKKEVCRRGEWSRNSDSKIVTTRNAHYVPRARLSLFRIVIAGYHANTRAGNFSRTRETVRCNLRLTQHFSRRGRRANSRPIVFITVTRARDKREALYLLHGHRRSCTFGIILSLNLPFPPSLLALCTPSSLSFTRWKVEGREVIYRDG